MDTVAPFLSGIRALDFTVNAAGPNSTWLLSALGVEVIKVESRIRPDPVRVRLKDRPYLHGSFYEDVNSGKRSVTIDLKTPEGRDTAVELIGKCDLVVDSFRPGVMDRLGLGYEVVHEQFPHVVVASLSATGSSGPLAGLPGYAGVFNALGGMGGLIGYDDGLPTELRTSIDLRAGAMFAAMMAWALHEARRTGRGSWVDFSAVEAVALLCGEYLTGELNGACRVDQLIGNRDDYWAPYGVYLTADGKWIAIGVIHEPQWGHLADLLRGAKLSVPEEWADRAVRVESLATIDALLTGWTQAQRADDLIAQLRIAGVPASVSMDGRDLRDSDQLKKTGFYQHLRAIDTGKDQVVLSPPWRVAGKRPEISPAHELGEDTRDVLSELLGLSPNDIDRLERAGALR